MPPMNAQNADLAECKTLETQPFRGISGLRA